MNEATVKDFKELATEFLYAIDQGTMTMVVAQQALAAKGFDIKSDAILIEQIGRDVAALANVAKSFMIFIHDVLPTNKTKATLSNGEVIEEHYYEANTDNFQKRIAKDEEHIKQFGNSGE